MREDGKMTDAQYKINLNTISIKAYGALNDVDKGFVGTPDYMGLAYFWGSNGCKHYLRDASIAQRKRIHRLWLEADLDLHGETLAHYAVIGQVMSAEVPTTEADLRHSFMSSY